MGNDSASARSRPRTKKNEPRSLRAKEAPVRIRRSSSLYKFFYNFRVTFNILVELLSNSLTFWTNRGHLLLGSLTKWVRIPARNNGQQVPSRPKWRVESKDLKSGRFLGQGCSGIFYEATWSGLRSRNLLARKDIPGVSSDVFEDEAARLIELEHLNIVKNCCWTVDKRSCTLVMEFVKDDLYTVVQKRKEALWKVAASDCPLLPMNLVDGINVPFKLVDAIRIMLEIATGIEYLHTRGVFHGDLKPNNVLVDLDIDPIVVKVADFGLVKSKRMATLIPEHVFCFRMIEWSAPEVFEDYFGSMGEDLDYIWTPSLTGSDMNTASASYLVNPWKADSYSFALTCAYILGGKMWNANLSPSELRKRIASNGLTPDRPELPPGCPETLASLISKCWDHCPKSRPTFSEILEQLQKIFREMTSGSHKAVQSQAPVAGGMRGSSRLPTPTNRFGATAEDAVGQTEDPASLGSEQTSSSQEVIIEETESSAVEDVAAASINAIAASMDGEAMNVPQASDSEEDAPLHQEAVQEINAVHGIEEAASDGLGYCPANSDVTEESLWFNAEERNDPSALLQLNIAEELDTMNISQFLSKSASVRRERDAELKVHAEVNLKEMSDRSDDLTHTTDQCTGRAIEAAARSTDFYKLKPAVCESEFFQVGESSHEAVRRTDNISYRGPLATPSGHMDIMNALSSGHCNVRRNDLTTGIFALPRLFYASGDEDINLPTGQQNNLQDAVDPSSIQRAIPGDSLWEEDYLGPLKREQEYVRQMETKQDLTAARNILGYSIPTNAITIRHYWLVLKRLRYTLSKGGSHKMPHGQDYARILRRLVIRKQDCKRTFFNDSHYYPPAFLHGLKEGTPDFEFSLDHDEFLYRLQQDLAAAFLVTRDDDEHAIVVMKDIEYDERLLSLARLLSLEGP